jgi:hypothetical protein
VRFTVNAGDPLPSGTTGFSNEVTSNEGTCQELEPACTATNSTSPAAPVPPPTVPRPGSTSPSAPAGVRQPDYPDPDSSHRLSFRCVCLRSSPGQMHQQHKELTVK